MRTTLKLIEPSSTSFGAEVFTLQSSEIEAEWPWVEKFLARVPRYDWTEQEVKADLVAGKAQLWGAIEGTRVLGIWITRIENSPTRFGVLWIASGEPLEVGLALYAKYTEPWFKEMGCEYVKIDGRKGWGRVLTEYREVARVFLRDL